MIILFIDINCCTVLYRRYDGKVTTNYSVSDDILQMPSSSGCKVVRKLLFYLRIYGRKQNLEGANRRGFAICNVDVPVLI